VALGLGCAGRSQLPPELRDSDLDRAPTVITSAAAVLFWLPSVDSLSADSTSAAIQLMSQAADDLRDLFSDTDVSLLVTTSTRIYVGARDGNGPRRIVSLAGLDYPWGVVFVEPGYAEQIVTGPIVPSDLRELAVDYFGLDTDDERTPIAGNNGIVVIPSAARNLVRRLVSPAMIGPDARLGARFLAPLGMTPAIFR